MAVLLNASVPGLPSGGLLVQAPAFASVGLPVEGLAVLIAVDMLPDVFRTAGNATSHLAAVVALTRRSDSAAGNGGQMLERSRDANEFAGV